jgi:hypothetical protein
MFTWTDLRETYGNLDAWRRHISEGWRPSFTPEVPVTIREVIERCWAAAPGNRPSFADIVKERAKLKTVDDGKFEEYWEYLEKPWKMQAV